MKRIFLIAISILVLGGLAFALPAKQGTPLTWTSPTTNNDGTPITNLAGYKVYWKSASSGSYADMQSKDVGNVTTVTIQSVTGSATIPYYFVVTAYNTSGSESGLSNEVRNNVPLAPAAAGSLTIN